MIFLQVRIQLLEPTPEVLHEPRYILIPVHIAKILGLQYTDQIQIDLRRYQQELCRRISILLHHRQIFLHV